MYAIFHNAKINADLLYNIFPSLNVKLHGYDEISWCGPCGPDYRRCSYCAFSIHMQQCAIYSKRVDHTYSTGCAPLMKHPITLSKISIRCASVCAFCVRTLCMPHSVTFRLCKCVCVCAVCMENADRAYCSTFVVRSARHQTSNSGCSERFAS